MSEEKRIKSEILADIMVQIFTRCAMLDLEYMEEFLESFRDSKSTYDAIGIVDGYSYLEKSESMGAKLARVEALVNLCKVLHETNDKMHRGDELESIREIFDQNTE